MPRKKSSKAPFDKTDLENTSQIEGAVGMNYEDKDEKETHDFLDLLAQIYVQGVLEKANHEEKLRKFPKGYHSDQKEGICELCGGPAKGENSWYDKHGLKCMCCQKAIDNKIIPVSLLKNKDSYYTKEQLQLAFNIPPKLLGSWLKEGIIKDRVIPALNGKGKHLQLFLLKDNKGFLPSPTLLRIGGPVKETRLDGQEEFVFYPWYYFVDPVEHLKKYSISKYMRWERE